MTLGSLVVTMVVGWFTVVNDVPTREEVSGMIQREAPYVHDRSGLIRQVDINTQSIERLEEKISDISRKQVRIETKLDIIIEKLEELKSERER